MDSERTMTAGRKRDYLTAWLLVMLKDRHLHGYEICKELRSSFDVAADTGSVYRLLRALERDGYIVSRWVRRSQGPARRIYALTQLGHEALLRWSVLLAQYRSTLDTFFTLYSGRWAKASRE